MQMYINLTFFTIWHVRCFFLCSLFIFLQLSLLMLVQFQIEDTLHDLVSVCVYVYF